MVDRLLHSLDCVHNVQQVLWLFLQDAVSAPAGFATIDVYIVHNDFLGLAVMCYCSSPCTFNSRLCIPKRSSTLLVANNRLLRFLVGWERQCSLLHSFE